MPFFIFFVLREEGGEGFDLKKRGKIV